MTSTKPAEVNTCLGKINTIGSDARLEKLTIDYTGATITSTNVDFATLLSAKKAAITDLNVNLKTTSYTSEPVITGFAALANLTLNYSNNGLDAATTKTLAASLKTAGSIASTSFTVTMSDAATDDNNFGDVKNLLPIGEATVSGTAKAKVHNVSSNCDITNAASITSCSFITLTPTVSSASPTSCPN